MKPLLILSLLILLSFSIQAQAQVRCEQVFGPSKAVEVEIQNFLSSTLKGFESLRGESGLVRDTVWIQSTGPQDFQVNTLNPDTSPTNIAVDLLIQAELLSRFDKKTSTAILATKNMTHIISVLEKISFHPSTGLFYTRYSTDNASTVRDPSVSSIDNLHLAMALWTLKEVFPNNNIGHRAERLFDRMNFSVYYDPSSGLIGGNLKYENGTWVREAYNFANLGSEARSLYGAGWALGLFRDQKNDPDFLKKSLLSKFSNIFSS